MPETLNNKVLLSRIVPLPLKLNVLIPNTLSDIAERMFDDLTFWSLLTISFLNGVPSFFELLYQVFICA